MEIKPLSYSEQARKLEVARAYLDMGDAKQARQLLSEVLKEGTVQEKETARVLLAKPRSRSLLDRAPVAALALVTLALGIGGLLTGEVLALNRHAITVLRASNPLGYWFSVALWLAIGSWLARLLTKGE